MNGPMLLKEARTKAGLTQSELARRLGVSQPEVARLESSRSNPRLGTLLRAVEATGHTLDASVLPRRSSLDESMIVSNLRLNPGERLERFARAYRSVASLRERTRPANGP